MGKGAKSDVGVRLKRAGPLTSPSTITLYGGKEPGRFLYACGGLREGGFGMEKGLKEMT